MTFASIATFLHDPNAGLDTLEFAIQAARRWNAHLHIVCAGIDRTDAGFYFVGAQAVAVQQNLEVAQSVAHELEVMVNARLKREDIAWDVEAITMVTSGIEPFLSDHMRFHELVILPGPFLETSDRVDTFSFEACLFGAAVPVLVVPKGAKMLTRPARLLVGWDNSSEALAATRAAIPIAKDAQLTEICVIDPPTNGIERSDPGGRIAQVLARAGACVEVVVTARQHNDLGKQLQQHAVETGADMIVMGAYSHSRLREAILGGVTRTMLEGAPVPVLMAH